jgi:hypothetical protein
VSAEELQFVFDYRIVPQVWPFVFDLAGGGRCVLLKIMCLRTPYGTPMYADVPFDMLSHSVCSRTLSLSLSLSLHLFPLIRSYSQSFSPCKPSTSHRALSGGRWNGTRMESGSVQRAPKANCNASRGKMTRTCVLLRGNAPVGGIPPEQENQRVSTVYSCSCCRTFPLPSTNRFLFICIYFEEAH